MKSFAPIGISELIRPLNMPSTHTHTASGSLSYQQKELIIDTHCNEILLPGYRSQNSLCISETQGQAARDEMNYYKYQQRPLLMYSHMDGRPMYGVNPMGHHYEYPPQYEYAHVDHGYQYIQRPTGVHYPGGMESDIETNHSQNLLQKLEMSGRVPSREKFRRMICQVSVCDYL